MYKVLDHVENTIPVLRWKEDNYLLTSAHKMEPRLIIIHPCYNNLTVIII